LKKAARIGELKHRIQIQRETQEPDGQGGQEVSWSDVATVWAKIEPVSASERLYTRQIQYQRTHKVIIRYLAGLTDDVNNNYRFLFDGRTFQIKGIYKLDEDKFWLKIDAEENKGS
jgi:SPP1 family predicted phage head-tail adaptor